MTDNPFDLYGLDPLASPDAITEALRERIEDAAPEARQGLRDAWEELTLHPKRRIALAIDTFIDPESESIVRPPPARAITAPAPMREAALGVPIAEVHATLVREGLSTYEPTGYGSIAADPLLKEYLP